MPLILAIEPDKRQAAQLKVLVRNRVHADLVLADTTELALEAIGDRIPDLVLVPALLSPEEDGALNAALRVIAAAAHVQTLTIPVFAAASGRRGERAPAGRAARARAAGGGGWLGLGGAAPAAPPAARPAAAGRTRLARLRAGRAERRDGAETRRIRFGHGLGAAGRSV